MRTVLLHLAPLLALTLAACGAPADDTSGGGGAGPTLTRVLATPRVAYADGPFQVLVCGARGCEDLTAQYRRVNGVICGPSASDDECILLGDESLSYEVWAW